MCTDRPDFDTVEEVGLDGTLRTGDGAGTAYNWRDVAIALQRLVRERMDDFALWEEELRVDR